MTTRALIRIAGTRQVKSRPAHFHSGACRLPKDSIGVVDLSFQVMQALVHRGGGYQTGFTGLMTLHANGLGIWPDRLVAGMYDIVIIVAGDTLGNTK